MMIKMVLDNLTNAIKNAKRRRVKVRHQEDDIYLVKCQNPDHPEPHAVYFEEREDGVYAACDCPSRVACYHLVSAWSLREHVQEVRRESAKRAEPDADGPLVKMPPRKPAEKYRGIRI